MSLVNFLKKTAVKALFSIVLLLGLFSFISATSAYASSTETVTGTFQALGQSVNFSADVPQNGGSFTGTFSGACSGSVTGNYDSSTKAITGNVNGSCTVLGVSHDGTFNFQGSADLANNKLTVSSVTRIDGSAPGSLGFVSLPITVDVQISNSNNNNTQFQGSPILDIPNLSVGQSYSLGSNSSIKFTNLPAGSNDINFKTVSLSSATGYQITSNMTNGSFTYDLTLPFPAGATNYIVKYSPNTDLSNAQIVTNSITNNGDGTITIHGLNHFTVFVVDTNPLSVACVGAGSNCYTTIQGAVDAASSGDTINIQSGTYNETVFVTKSLTLNGVDSGSGIPSVTKIVVWASGVSVNNINTSQVDGRPSATFTNPVKNSNKTSVSITGTGYANSNISWSISDSGSAHTVSGTSTVSAGGNISITGIDLSSLNDGTLTLTLTLNDGAGHTSSSSVSTSFKDTVAPAAPSVSLTNPINNANKTSVSITGTGEAGASFSYTITDGTTTLSGSGTVSSSGSISVTGINVSSLSDGTITLSVTQTDTVGNTSSAGTATSTKDVVAPTVSAGSNKTTNAQFTQTGTVTDPSPSSGIATYAWSMVSGPGTITFGSSSAVSTTISANTDGTYVIRLTSTDNAGNSASATFTLVWDTTPPTISAGADQVKNGIFTQTGTASDSLSGVATTTWSKVSGPGTITFGSVNSLSTTVTAGTDGAYVIRLTVTDNAGNTSIDDFNLTWDTVAPTVSAGANVVTNSVFSLTGTATDPSPSSGIATIAWSQVSGPGTVTFTSPSTLSTNASANTDGTYVLRLTVTDNAGNSSSSSLTLVWDTTPPTISAGADQVKNGIFTQTGTASDSLSGVNTIQWSKISGPGTITFGSSTSLTTTISASVDGNYVIQLAVTDNAGNLSTDTMALTWDTAPPVVSAGSNVVTNAQFTQTGTVTDPSPSSGIASTTWSMVSGTGTITFGTPNATSTTISASADGTYVLRLTAIDNAGNTTSSTFTLVWDTVAPTVSAGSNVVTNVQFTQTGTVTDPSPSSGIATYAWTQVSGPGTITFGSSSAISTTISANADGAYVIRLTSTDNAGNSSSSTFNLTWDTVAPSVNAGSDVTTNAQFTQVGTITDPSPTSGIASITWSMVSGTGTITFGSANAATTTVSASADGTYVIKLTAVDNAGNSNSDTFILVWDTVAPTVNAGSNKTTNAQFTQTGTVTDAAPSSGIASYAWTVVSGPGTITFGSANAVSTTISANTDGTYVIKLTATDNAGNSANSTFSLVWDTVSPIVGAGSNVITNAQFTQTGTVTDPAPSSGIASYAWTQVSGPGTITFGSASAISTTVSASADGTYVIRLTVTDNAGNSASNIFTLTWDTVAPSVNAGADVTTNAQFTQVGSATDSLSGVASYSWTMVSGPGTITFGSAGSATTTVSASADGTYVIQLSATDNAGNTGVDTFTLVWDTAGPTVSAGANITTNAQFSKTAAIADPSPSSGIATIAWSMVSGPGSITFGSASAATTTISASADGTYVIQVVVTDNAGNTTTSNFTLVWDTVSPVVSAGSNVTTNAQFTQNGTVSDAAPSSGIASTTWTMVSGTGTITFGTPNATTTTISASADGTYIIKLTAVDNAGNSTSSQFTLVWDTVAPTVSAGSNVVTNAQFTTSATATDPAPASGIAFYSWTMVSGTGTITFGTPNALNTTVSASADGTYTIKLTVTDNAGNSNSSQFTLTWDTAAPVVSAGANVVTNAQFTTVATAVDNAPSSGIATYAWVKVSGPGTITFGTPNALNTTVSASADGTYVIRLTVADNAGNSTSSTFTLVWDTVAPTVSAGSNVSTNTSVTITGTATDNAPSSGIATYAWTMVSGPGTITFGSANAISTTVSASADGSYVLKLTVTDNAGNSAFSTMTFVWDTVAPVVNAGSNVVTNAQFTTSATATDAAPSSGIATYAWTMVSGPGTITFGTAGSLNTTVRANTDGVYIIKLTVTDLAGNSTSSTFTLTWDTTPPTVDAGADINTTSAFTRTGTASDSLSVTISLIL